MDENGYYMLLWDRMKGAEDQTDVKIPSANLTKC